MSTFTTREDTVGRNEVELLQRVGGLKVFLVEVHGPGGDVQREFCPVGESWLEEHAQLDSALAGPLKRLESPDRECQEIGRHLRRRFEFVEPSVLHAIESETILNLVTERGDVLETATLSLSLTRTFNYPQI